MCDFFFEYSNDCFNTFDFSWMFFNHICSQVVYVL
jgi:hypothetical protein